VVVFIGQTAKSIVKIDQKQPEIRRFQEIL